MIEFDRKHQLINVIQFIIEAELGHSFLLALNPKTGHSGQ